MPDQSARLSQPVWDIVVVGGGLVGSAIGLALKDYPRRVAVLDSNPQPNSLDAAQGMQKDKRSIGLSDSSRQILQMLGVWSSLAAAAMPIRNIHVSQKGSLGVTRIRAEDEGVEALGWVVPYTTLQNALRHKAASEDGVDYFAATTVQELFVESDNQAVVLRVQHHQEVLAVKARHIILAEGGGALLESAGFETRRFDYRQAAIVTSVQTDKRVGDVAYERFTRHGPVAVLPQANGSYGVVWVHPNAPGGRTGAGACATWPDALTGALTRALTGALPRAQEILAWEPHRFIAGLQEDLGMRIGKITAAEPPGCFPLTYTQTTRLVKGRIVVLGNAAHTIHPVAAQSFNLSLRDLAWLAESLMRVDDQNNIEEALKTWQQQRQQDIQRVSALTHFLSLVPTIPGAHLVSGKAMLLLELFPLLRRLLIRRSLGLSPPQSRLASGLSLD